MAANYFRQNPHRLHLGIIGLELIHADGIPVIPEDITEIHQELDMWSGKFTADSKLTIPLSKLSHFATRTWI